MAWLAACGGGSAPTAPSTPPPAATPPPPPSGGGGGGGGGQAVTVAYTNDIRPIFESDCTICHNSILRTGGVDLSTYSGALRVVTPGSANSTLVRVTRPGGIMFVNLTGEPNAKSDLIQRWVVDNNAAETR
jgi:hypothetical protein